KKKLKLAAAWEMKAFFVAREQLPEAQTGSGEMKILGLAQGRFRLERAIQEFVVRQKAEPEAPNGLDDQEGLRRNLEHWEFLPAELKGPFYDKHLFPWVLARFADLTLQEPNVAQARPLRALVTIVSGQKDTTILAARALSRLGIQHCLLLYSRDQNEEQKKKAIAIRDELREVLRSAGRQW